MMKIGMCMVAEHAHALFALYGYCLTTHPLYIKRVSMRARKIELNMELEKFICTKADPGPARRARFPPPPPPHPQKIK